MKDVDMKNIVHAIIYLFCGNYRSMNPFNIIINSIPLVLYCKYSINHYIIIHFKLYVDNLKQRCILG